MKAWFFGGMLAGVFGFALIVSSVSAAPVFTGSYIDMYLKQNTFPSNLSEEMVFLDAAQSSTITGHVGSQTGTPLVMFSSTTDTLDAANGYSGITAQDGYINDLTITAPGYWFDDLIFSVNLTPNSNNDVSVSATDKSGNTEAYTGWTGNSDWVNGDNRILLLSTGGNLMKSVTIQSQYGFSISAGIDQLKQTEMSGLTPAVPLPATIWLLGSGLLGLIGVSRRHGMAAVV